MARQKPPIEATALAPQEPSSSDVSLSFERLARDPNVDVAKLERLIAMQERILAHQARASFFAAFQRMQPAIPSIDEQGRVVIDGELRNTYAKYADIQDVVKPVLREHGFTLFFKNTYLDNGKVRVTGILAHEAGHVESTEFVSDPDKTGGKNPIQAIGSSRSYGRRYCTMDLLNITSRAFVDRDDDGESHEPDLSMPQASVRPSTKPKMAVVPKPEPEIHGDPFGRVVEIIERGAGVIVVLSTGFRAATKDPEKIQAVRMFSGMDAVVELQTRASSDPSRFAPVITEVILRKRS